MYKHLVKVLDKWSKSQAKMLEGEGKMDVKDMCHFALVIEIFIQRWMHQAEEPLQHQNLNYRSTLQQNLRM
jgi:hypothetical protein